MVDKSVEVGKHGNVALGSKSTTRTQTDVNACLEFPTVSEAHGIHSHASANEESMNDVGTMVRPTPVGGKYGLVHSMFSSSTGLLSFQFSSMDGLDSMLENGSWFIRNNPLILKKWHPDVNLLKEDVSTIPVWVKIHGVPITAFSEDGLSAIATKIGTPLMLDSYTSDIHVSKKLTANSSGNKKKGMDHTNKFSDSNPFEVLNSVDNDVEMGTNGGMSKLDNNGANSSGSSFWNVENSSTSTTPNMDKIGMFENLIIDGQAILVDEDGNPLNKLEYPGDHDSEDEVASVDNDMARSLASERTGFGT
ncbi:hypothetical protein Tco_0742618 [Tanacetum coccineum]